MKQSSPSQAANITFPTNIEISKTVVRETKALLQIAALVNTHEKFIK
jgi:hypothetical protein